MYKSNVMANEPISLHNGVMMRLVQNMCKNDMYVVDQNGESDMLNKREYSKLMAGYASWMASNFPQLFASIGRYLDICTSETTELLLVELYGTLPYTRTEDHSDGSIMYNMKLDDIVHVIITFSYAPKAVMATMFHEDNPIEKQSVDTVSSLCNFIEKYTGEKIVMDQ